MKRRLLVVLLVALCTLGMAGTLPIHAQGGSSWFIQYFPNTTLTPPASFTQNAPSPSFNWGFETAPGPNMPRVNWSANLSSNVFFYAGTYRFTFTVDDGLALRINNRLIFSNLNAPQPGQTFSVDVQLPQGYNFISLDFVQHVGSAFLFFNWVPVSGGSPGPTLTPTPAPGAPISPPPASLVTQFGDYTRCAQQNIHQSNCFVSDGQWNSPDLGSIQLEPQISIWTPCNPGDQKMQQVVVGGPQVATQCSKTGAGYFIQPI